MRHRGPKIKYEHRMIQGLRELLEEIETCPEIQSIIPGRINRTKANGKRLALKVQMRTHNGLKCQARSGQAVQEVFIVTSNAEAVIRYLEPYMP